MSNLKNLIFGFIIISCSTNQNKEKVAFNIRFDSCYDNDTVSLYLDNNEIFKDYILKTDDVIGLTPIYITYLNSRIIRINNGKETVIEKKIDLHDPINIKVLLNNKETDKIIEVSKGKNITIDGCASDYGVNIHQYKNKVIYD